MYIEILNLFGDFKFCNHIRFTIESCPVRIELGKRIIIVVAIYRHPSGSLESFCDSVSSLITRVDVRNCEIILTGVINIDLLK